jgi:hypothetical protein
MYEQMKKMKHWKEWGIAAIVLFILMAAAATYLITDAVMKKEKDKKNGGSCNKSVKAKWDWPPRK